MGHSPLTGIFLIRRYASSEFRAEGFESQSPDGDFFDPEAIAQAFRNQDQWSQSPDGDFFDPE